MFRERTLVEPPVIASFEQAKQGVQAELDRFQLVEGEIERVAGVTEAFLDFSDCYDTLARNLPFAIQIGEASPSQVRDDIENINVGEAQFRFYGFLPRYHRTYQMHKKPGILTIQERGFDPRVREGFHGLRFIERLMEPNAEVQEHEHYTFVVGKHADAGVRSLHQNGLSVTITELGTGKGRLRLEEIKELTALYYSLHPYPEIGKKILSPCGRDLQKTLNEYYALRSQRAAEHQPYVNAMIKRMLGVLMNRMPIHEVETVELPKNGQKVHFLTTDNARICTGPQLGHGKLIDRFFSPDPRMLPDVDPLSYIAAAPTVVALLEHEFAKHVGVRE